MKALQAAVGPLTPVQTRPGFARAWWAAKARGDRPQRFTCAVGAAPDSPAMLGLAAHRGTHFVRCAHAVRTTAMRVMTNRAAREAASPVLLGAPEARCDLSPHAFAETLLVFAANNKHISSRQAVPGGGDLWGAEQNSLRGGTRSALRNHSRRGCLNAANAMSEVSSATHPVGEHRRTVAACRRPLKCELPPGTACRDARTAGEDQ